MRTSTYRVGEHEVAVSAIVLEDADREREAMRRATSEGGISVYTAERAWSESVLIIVGPEEPVTRATESVRDLGPSLSLGDLQATAIADRWLQTLHSARERGDRSVAQRVRWPRRHGGDQ